MTTPKQVGIWLRVSTEDQVKGESLEVHEHRARAYAQSKGWEVAQTYRLEAVSGKRVIDHPEARRMLRDVEEGRISGLIFSKLARLSRNNRELLDFSEIFQRHDADLISLAESIDTSTPAGRMFYNMLSAMANWEREEIQSRVAASVPIRAKLGKPLGGPAPYGYAWVNKELVVDRGEAPVRILIYHLYQKHKRRQTVAKLLNDMGHRTRSGGLWTDTTVERLLRDTTAKGWKRANYTRQTDPVTCTWELKPESEWVYTPVEALVSAELFDECVGHLDSLKKAGRRMTRRSPHLFTGFARCQCGGAMRVPSRSPKYVCKECKRDIPSDTLEDCFLHELTSYALSEAELAKERKDTKVRIKELDDRIALHEENIKKADAKTNALIELYEQGALDIDGFKERNATNLIRKQELAEELPRLVALRNALSQSLDNSEAALNASVSLQERWPNLSRQDKRLIIEAIVSRIDIREDEVEFSFLFTGNLPTRRTLPPRTPISQNGHNISTQP
jgi:site-specific DNA recombinase